MKERGGGQGFILMMWDTNPAMPYLAYSKVQNKDMCPNKHTGRKKLQKTKLLARICCNSTCVLCFCGKKHTQLRQRIHRNKTKVSIMLVGKS